LYDFDSYTNIVAGIQVNPIENVTAFLDYTMVDEIYADDDTIDLGVSYSF
jgi:opacity protein-like surface antigen